MLHDMVSALSKYTAQFQSLRTDRSKVRWPAATQHRAPHKPFLLLTVLDLIEEGIFGQNHFELTRELVETFARYWATVPTGHERGNVVYPFFHMRSEPFWHLQAQPEKEPILASTTSVSSIRQLQRLAQGAAMDAELFDLASESEPRWVLRKALIEAYFDVSSQPMVLQQATLNVESFAYSQELLKGTSSIRMEDKANAGVPFTAIRSQGFRRAVVVAYARRCALCGIRVSTLDGHTAVDAAHIVPWRVSHNDHPTNGIALCRLCHWAFDEGMLAVNNDYTILTAAQLREGDNTPAHLGAISGREMIRPLEQRYWPSQGSLAWHRRTIFRLR